MKRLIIILIPLLIIASPALALKKLSDDELKKVTAQIASSAGVASDISSPTAMGYELGSNIAGGNDHAGNIATVLSPAGVAQTTTEPVSIVFQIVGDANSFKSGVSMGFF